MKKLIIACILIFPLLTGCGAQEREPEHIVDITPAPLSAPPVSTPAPTPAPEPTPTPEPTPPGLDTVYGRLINPAHTMDPEEVPENLVRVADYNDSGALTLKKDSIRAEATALAAFNQMLSAAKTEGVEGFYLVSVYRTYEEQQALWDKKVAQDPAYGTDPTVPVVTAAAGTSEHQSGLAFDVTANDARAMSAKFAQTPQGEWLYAHCHRYGFILRYPKGRERETGVVFEPWHFRYVGPELAAYLTEKDMVMDQLTQ